MHKMTRVGVGVAMLAMLGLGGCATYQPMGAFYTSGKMGVDAHTADASKEGKACMESYIGLIARGDASVETAMENGGITEVASVDYTVDNVLGIYGKYCTVVRGD
jgi:hypothetical protein